MPATDVDAAKHALVVSGKAIGGMSENGVKIFNDIIKAFEEGTPADALWQCLMNVG